MFLLDTNVVSELRKIRSGRADQGVARWAAIHPLGALYLSVITIQELEIGILLAERRDAMQGKVLRRWFEEQLTPAFAGRVLEISESIAGLSAAMHVPDPRPFRDGFIAATALHHRMTVVTRNSADFKPMGVQLVNPWLNE